MAAKLTYFDMTGLGEPVRLMLCAANIEFEDVRVKKDDWAKLKPTLKWPHLPMLEIDGKTLFQSLSICRYLARKINLCGTSEDEALFCDITVDTLDDLRKKFVPHYYSPDSKERDENLEQLAKEAVPFYLKKFQEQLVENNGYLVGGKLTWADIMFVSYADYISTLVGRDILADFPKLKQHQEKISQLPHIKEWIASRPAPPKDLRVLFF